MLGILFGRVMRIAGLGALVAIGVPAVVCLSGHLRGKGQCHSGDGSCAAPSAAEVAQISSAGEKAPFNAGREILFKVESLGCPLVGGLGCGHRLAPVMARIDRLEAVEQSFCNWSGQEIRVIARGAAQRELVAKRVMDMLGEENAKASRIDEAELEGRIDAQSWFGGAKIGELTAYEFRTVAKERAAAFAASEKLDEAVKQKLLAIVERQWEQHGAHPATKPSDAESYAGYWKPRMEAFKKAEAAEAKGVLSGEQFEHLKAKLAERGSN